jgi:FkbM family methyltransferase
MNINKKIKNYLLNRLTTAPQGERRTYSQCGEDILLEFVLNELGIENPRFIDIGAHHPTYLNNTYLFYKKGCFGINVEPDPHLFQEFTKQRNQDINLNVGVGMQDEKAQTDFYIMTARVLNTFSKEEAIRIHETTQYKIEKVIPIDLVSVNSILKTHFKDKAPDLISIDVEGWDFEIIKSLDLTQLERTVFCVETLTYTEDKSEKKRNDIIDYLVERGFFVCADTYINSIFVNKKVWADR